MDITFRLPVIRPRVPHYGFPRTHGAKTPRPSVVAQYLGAAARTGFFRLPLCRSGTALTSGLPRRSKTVPDSPPRSELASRTVVGSRVGFGGSVRIFGQTHRFL